MRDRIENGLFVGGRPAAMNDARPAVSNATTALFPSGVNLAGNSATEYRTREDSEVTSPATKLLRRGFSFRTSHRLRLVSLRAPAHVTLASVVSDHADDSQSARRDCIRRNLYSCAGYSRTTLMENPGTSLRFILERHFSLFLSRK